jgi:hypothetical protein
MVNTFLAALQQGPNAEVLNIYGNYAFNVLHDPDLALRLWDDAAKLAPNVVQYQVTLARLMIASGRPDLAGPYIAKVRQLGRWGQNDALAHEMEQLAEQESRRHPSSTPAVPVSPKSGPQ